APGRRRATPRPPRPAGRLRQVGRRHRAPPGGHGARRLDHRPRPRGRPRRRAGRLRGRPRPPRAQRPPPPPPAAMPPPAWIIDPGPGAGHDGGRIVFEGTPADLVATRSTLTGQHLADYVGAVARPKAARARGGTRRAG